MAERLAWVLNFDAELEMADPEGYRPSTRMLARCDALTRQVAPVLSRCLGEEIRILHRGRTRRSGPDLAGARALAWAWTPSAVRCMTEQGVQPLPLPDFAAVRHVNHRAFLAGLQAGRCEAWPGLPGEGFIVDLARLEPRLRDLPPSGRWILKRPFGFAGRDRKVLEGASLVGADRTWCLASMQGYGIGLQVEPWVEIREEYGLHAWLDRRGGIQVGALQVQEVDDSGAFVGTRPGPPGTRTAEAMAEVLGVAAAAAAREGYFGPLGLDAFLWQDATGATRLRVASDLNARFSMAWFEGMEDWLGTQERWPLEP